MSDSLDQNSDSRRSDEDLLAWILNQPKDSADGVEMPSSQSTESSEELAARMADMQGFLGRCRSEVFAERDTEERNTSFLARRILKQTVQEDVSVQADLGLVRGFVRNRLAASGLLRIVAASLLLHMGALPVMAYYVWVRPKPQPVVTFYPLPQVPDLPFQEVEPEAFPELDLSLGTLLDLEGELAAVQTLTKRHTDVRGVWTDDLGLILGVERMLSEQVLSEAPHEQQESLGRALKALEQSVERLQGQPELPALRRLAASAWFRARSAGLDRPQLSQASDGDTVVRESELESWLGDQVPLTGIAWEESCTKADEELANRGK
jgi:hypothetical protein